MQPPSDTTSPIAGERHWFASIQGLRGVAAVLVAAGHAIYMAKAMHPGGPMPSLAAFYNLPLFGACGVHLFFVISGFVMAVQPFNGPFKFLSARLVRIVPMYWLVTMLAFSVTTPHPDLTALAKSFLFIPSAAEFPVLSVGWTLNFEMYFYVLFALASMWGRPAVTLATLFGALAALYLFTDGRVPGMLAAPITLEFVAGMAIASFCNRFNRAWGAAFVATGAALLVSTIFWFDPKSGFLTFAGIAWGGPAALIVLGAAVLEKHGVAILRQRAFQFVGAASYSIYLVHLVVIWQLSLQQAAHPHLRFFDTNASVLAVAAVACGAGLLVYLLIERPLLRLAATLRMRERTPREGGSDPRSQLRRTPARPIV